MKLLLKESVRGLGDVGEVVEVSDGYGRNYLLPQRLAVPNTPENQREIKTLRLLQVQREEERTALAERAVKDLKNALLQVRLKAQDDGSLYGSGTQQVICDVVFESKGYRLEDRWIQLSSPIKKIGDYDIVVRLPGDQQTQFKLTVLPEESE